MKPRPSSRLLRRGTRREKGQALVLTMLALVVLIGFAGLVIDIGRLYVAQRELQQAVDASALAAGQDIPNSVNAYAAALNFSATSLNRHPTNMSANAPTVTFKCLSSLAPSLPCATDVSKVNCHPSGAAPPVTGAGAPATTCNAVAVTETASVSTTLLHLFLPGGFTTVSASSVAAARGGVPHPLDVMVVLDTTASMSSVKCGDAVQNEDGTTAMSTTQSYDIDCAKDGVRRLLRPMWPCAPSVLGNCGVNAPPLDEVGLAVFPGLTNYNGWDQSSTHTAPYTDLELDLNARGTVCAGNQTIAPSWYIPAGTPFPGWFLSTNDVGYPTNGTNAVQTITVSKATGGTFTLTVVPPGGASVTTAAISYSATAATEAQNISTALAAVLGGAANVQVSPGGGAGQSVVTFMGSLGAEAIPTMTSKSSLTGTGASISIANTTTGVPPVNAQYLITLGLSNTFKLSDAATTLNPTSQIAEAVTWDACTGGTIPTQGGGPNSYYGVSAAGGAGTYFAGAITVAQQVLAGDATRNAQPVIILLSDGDATTAPDGPNPCQQAVAAATAAAQAGTWVYSIAYNSATTGSCTNDTSGLTPFTTMQQIARSSTNTSGPNLSDPTKFYCDPVPAGQTCNNASGATLADIFTSIGTSLTDSRLIPANTQ